MAGNRDGMFELQGIERIEWNIHLLGAQGEGGTGDAGGQVQPLDDLLPQLLVDNIHQAAAGYHQIVQLVEIQHRFGHYRQPIDRSS